MLAILKLLGNHSLNPFHLACEHLPLGNFTLSQFFLSPSSHCLTPPAAVRPFQLLSDPSSYCQTLPAAVRPFQLLSDPSSHCQTLPVAVRPFQPLSDPSS